MTSGGRKRSVYPAYPSESSGEGIALILLIFILGLVLRLFAYRHTGIINPDGALYINQAKAIYYGHWNSMDTCGTAYLTTITTLCIAAAYPILGDWVAAGTAVPIFFGTMTLVPLYFLTRRFFAKDISSLIVLTYALTPVLIDGSVDIVRDSTAWFFMTLGFYFFAKEKTQNTFCLIMSGISFILATWTRVEFFIFVVLSPLYIFIDGNEKPFRRAAVFLLPVAVILFAAIGSQLLAHSDRVNWYRLMDIPDRASIVFSKYQGIRAALAELINHPAPGIPTEFFDNTRDILWFVGFGVILQNALEAYYYPFFLLYLIGMGNIRRQIGQEGRVLYFVLLALAAFLLLYCYVFLYWQMENRWLTLALFPSFIFLGFGLERLISFMQSKFSMKRGMALFLICLLLLAFALPKNLKPRGEDKIIFRQLGETIADLEGNVKKISILTIGDSARWIWFYANAHFPGALCSDEFFEYESMIGGNYGEFVKRVKLRGIQYVVWQEKHWSGGRFDLLALPYQQDFSPLGSWRHPDTGTIMVFKVR